MNKAMSKKNFEKGQEWAASQDDPRYRYLAKLTLGAPLGIQHRCGHSTNCRYLGIKPDSERPIIVSQARKILRVKVSDVHRADADVLRGIMPSGESFEIHQCLSDSDLDCIRTCGHEWVVFSTALAEVWLMLQCVHCGAHASVNDPSSEEWGEAFYAPDHPYLWSDKSRVTIRGIARRHVYKAGDEPPSDPESKG